MDLWKKVARLLAVLATAFAATFTDHAYATKKFSDLSMGEMRQAFEDANLADDCYVDDVAVRDGYKPSGGFLNSQNITVRSKLPDGNTIFSFNDYTQDKDRKPSAYVYNPKNGMITPYAGAAAAKAGYDSNPPNFCAQVLDKDGTTHIAFRGSAGNKNDWVDTNIGQGLGALPAQYVMADTLVQSVQNTGSRPVHLTGHSEGGGEVQWAMLESVARGNTDVSGSAFNYAQLSKGLKNMFPQEVQDKAGAQIKYFRVGNDVVSGSSLAGDGPLGEDIHLGDAEWKGDAVGLIDPNHAGQAHRVTTAISMITAAIGDKAKEDRQAKKGAEETGKDTDNAAGKKDDAKTGGDKSKDGAKNGDGKKASDKDGDKVEEDKGKDGDKDDTKKADEKKDGDEEKEKADADKGKDDAKKDDGKKDGDKDEEKTQEDKGKDGDKDDAKKDEDKKDDDGKKAGSGDGGKKKGDKDKEKIDEDKDEDKDKDKDEDKDEDNEKDEDKDKDTDEDKDKDQEKDNDLKNMEGGDPPSNDGPQTSADDPKGGSLGGFMEDTDSANTQKTDAGFSLGEHNTSEQRQAAENEIAKQNADATKEQGGRDADSIKNASEAKTAAEQANNSWSAGVAKEMVNISTSFGGGLGGGAGGVVGDAVQQAILKHQNHHGGGHHGGGGHGDGGGAPAASGGTSGGHGDSGHHGASGGGSGGKHASTSKGGKKTSGSKSTGGKKSGGTKKSGKKKTAAGSGCAKCSKSPAAWEYNGKKYCTTCYDKMYHSGKIKESGTSSKKDDAGGSKKCASCGKMKDSLQWDNAKMGYVCYDCLGWNRFGGKKNKTSGQSSKSSSSSSSGGGSSLDTATLVRTCPFCKKVTSVNSPCNHCGR